MCKVSIIIPVYKVEKYLQQCIDSLVNQTLSDIEMIFVNDASPDNCQEILERNAELHPGLIKVIALKENRCIGGARNAGINAASGKYIGFVDSDDFVSETMFEELFKASESTEADISFIQYTSVPENIVYQVGKQAATTPFVTWDQCLLQAEGQDLTDLNRSDLIAYKTGGVYCGLYRKDFLMRTNIDYPEGLRYEDNFWGSLIKAYATRVTYVEKIGYYYRYNPMSTTRLKNRSFHNDRITIEHMLISEAKKRSLFDRFHEAWEYLYITRYFWNTFQLFLTQYDVPQVDRCVNLATDLKAQFPDWYNNLYFKRNYSIKTRTIIIFAVQFPRIAAEILKLQSKVKRRA